MEGTYFCKLLQVEGEIKSGDLFQFPGMPIHSCIGTDDGLIWYESNNPQIDSASCDPGDCQRMALHFCDYYYGIGDTVYMTRKHKYPAGGLILKTNTDVMNAGMTVDDDDLESVEYSMFRVIGLVSPAATWMMEGGAWAPKQLAVQAKEPGNFHRLDLILRLEGKEPNTTYLVECPCCGAFK